MPFYPPNSSSHDGNQSYDPTFWSFADVQARLVEAHDFLRRTPDRDWRFLRVAISSLYQQINPLEGLTAIELRQVRREREADAPRMPALTRDEIARMEETLAWLEWIADANARKIVHMAVAQLASGRQTRIAWGSLNSDPKRPGSDDRLRKAYGRAITGICNRLNAASKLG